MQVRIFSIRKSKPPRSLLRTRWFPWCAQTAIPQIEARVTVDDPQELARRAPPRLQAPTDAPRPAPRRAATEEPEELTRRAPLRLPEPSAFVPPRQRTYVIAEEDVITPLFRRFVFAPAAKSNSALLLIRRRKAAQFT